MRLLTYNIHGCVGRRGVADPEAALEVIREADADIVALQEVCDDREAGRFFLSELERRFDYAEVVYDPTRSKCDSRCGNVLMSRLPLTHRRRLDLSLPGREPRAAIRARLVHGGRTFEITATHLGLGPAERRAQIRRLADPDGGAPLPPDAVRVLMGDLNEWFPFGRAARMLRRRFGPVRHVPTFPSFLPLFAIDSIRVLPASVRVVKRVPAGEAARNASDHLPLVAELAFPGG